MGSSGLSSVSHPQRPRGRAFIAAIVVTAVAGLLRAEVPPGVIERAVLLPFLFSALIAAWLGGIWPGLLATALGGAGRPRNGRTAARGHERNSRGAGDGLAGPQSARNLQSRRRICTIHNDWSGRPAWLPAFWPERGIVESCRRPGRLEEVNMRSEMWIFPRVLRFWTALAMVLLMGAIDAAPAAAGLTASTLSGATEITSVRDADMVVAQRVLENKVVAQKLRDYGVSPEEAKLRLASMSDQDLHTLASSAKGLPTGGDDAIGLLIGILVIVLLVILILKLMNKEVVVK
jgi:hypothetical protein